MWTGAITSIFGVLFAGIFGWKQIKDPGNIEGRKARAKTAIMNSTVVAPDIPFFIHRRELISKIQESLFDVDTAALSKMGKPFIPTTIICGPRGCGKSTLINESMQKRSAVVKIFYEGENSEDFAIAVLRSLRITLPDNTDPVTFLLEVLEMLNTKPIFVMEVDKRFGSKHLEQLLLLLKRLGDDLQLMVPIVVLSSSRSALSLELSATSLRAEFFPITDLTENECRQFLQSVMDTLKISDDEKRQAIDFGMRHIGNRLVDLHAVANCIRQVKCSSLEEYQSVVITYSKQQIQSYQAAFATFALKCPRIRDRHVLEKLTNGLEILDLCKALGISQEELLELNSTIEPHVLYICPNDCTVIYGSHFMRVVIDHEIEGSSWWHIW